MVSFNAFAILATIAVGMVSASPLERRATCPTGTFSIEFGELTFHSIAALV
jgi:hypothetical protein